ncbi:MAG: hypothetical protein AAF938_13435, partial [Myxococcota bacterium]
MANTMLAVARATSDVQIEEEFNEDTLQDDPASYAVHTFPPQERSVRAALAEAAVLVTNIAAERAHNLPIWPESYGLPHVTEMDHASCATQSLLVPSLTLLETVEQRLIEIDELAHEAADIAARDYQAVADELRGDSLAGASSEQEVRLHAARFIAGGGAIPSLAPAQQRSAPLTNRFACSSSSRTPAVSRAIQLIRDTGLPPDIVRAVPASGLPTLVDTDTFVDAGTAQPSLKRRLARLWGVADRVDPLSVTEFLAEQGLTPDDIDAARQILAEEYDAFSRDGSVLDPERAFAPDGSLDTNFYAATGYPPLDPIASIVAGIVADPGFVTTFEDFNAGAAGGGLIDGTVARYSLSSWSHHLRRLGLRYRADGTATGVDALGERLVARSAVEAVGEMFVGDLNAAGFTPSVLVVSKYQPFELLVTNDISSARCAVNGTVEGVECSWLDVSGIEGLPEFGSGWLTGPASGEPIEAAGDYRTYFDLSSLGASDVIYVLARQSGANSSTPGTYSVVGVGPIYHVTNSSLSPPEEANYHYRRALAPELLAWAGRLAAPQPDNCADPLVSCGEYLQFSGRLPLEDSLTDDGSEYEDSFRRYLALARAAATESDALGRETFEQGLRIRRTAEAAADELENLCGARIDLALFDALPSSADPMEWLADPAQESLADQTSRRALLRCLAESEVLPLATLGQAELCVWYPDADISRLCEVEGTPTDLACPAFVEPGEACAAPPGPATYETVRLDGDALLGLIDRPTTAPPNVLPNMCDRFRAMRGELETNGTTPAFITEWRNIILDSGNFSLSSLSQLSSRIRFALEPGTNAKVFINDEPVLTTGSLRAGPSSTGPCSGVLECPADQAGGLFCAPEQCGNAAGRLNVVARWAAASTMARWLGQNTLVDFGGLGCTGRNGDNPVESFFETHQNHIGGTFSDDELQAYCSWSVNEQTAEEVVFKASCSNPHCGEDAVSFGRIEAESPFGTRGVSEREMASHRRAAAFVVQNQLRYLPFWENLAENSVQDLAHVTNSYVTDYPWVQFAGSGGAQQAAFGVHFTGPATSMTRLSLLDGLELLCEAAEGAEGSYDLIVPSTITADDVDQLAVALNAQADGVRAIGNQMIVRDMPRAIADRVRAEAASTLPDGFEGALAQQAADASTSLLGIASTPASLADELEGMARDVRLVNGALRRIRLGSDIRRNNLMRDISNQVAECARAAARIGGDLMGMGGRIAEAAIVCSNSAIQIVYAIENSGLQDEIDQIDRETTLTQFLDTTDQRGSTIRGIGDRLRVEQIALGRALAEMTRLRSNGRRALRRALGLSTEAAGLIFESEAIDRSRYDIDRVRYERARLNAIRMADLARRSIEQRLGLELSTIETELPLVAAPATWVDSLCTLSGIDYDTLSGTSTAVSGAYEKSFIGDYVTDLENFLESYRLAFPFLDGQDTVVVSLRDDLSNTRAMCRVDSPNLLFWNDDLSQRGTSETPGWALDGCATDGGTPLPNCIGSRRLDSVALSSEPGLGLESASLVEFAPPHPDCVPTVTPDCPCPTSECGYQSGAALAQPVVLEPGEYRVSWWTKSAEALTS